LLYAIFYKNSASQQRQCGLGEKRKIKKKRKNRAYSIVVAVDAVDGYSACMIAVIPS
jgi:hypothetical protein